MGFLGLGTHGSFGLLASTISQDTPLRVIVDNKTTVPGGNGFFGDIPQTPSLAGVRFLFNVGAADGRTGIYSASSSDDITAHVTFSATIGGQSIVYMGIQTDSFNGDVFSFYAVTTIDIIAQTKLPRARRW